MSQIRIPATAGTYFLAANAQVAALVSSLPTAINLSDGNWVESTRTLSSFLATPMTNNPLVAGDIVNITGGTGVIPGQYVVAATTGASPTSVTLMTSPSKARVDLSNTDIVANSTVGGLTMEGYLRNPARTSNGKFAGRSSMNIRRVSVVGAMAAATDSLDICVGDGTNVTGAMQFLATSLARADVFDAGECGTGSGVTSPNTLCLKTTGNTGWVIVYDEMSK